MLQSVIGLGDDTTGTESDSGETDGIRMDCSAWRWFEQILDANCGTSREYQQ